MNKLKYFFFIILVCLSLSNFGQTLTISNTGQTGISGNNWSISGTTLTVSGGNANIRASVIENALVGGDLTVNAENIIIQEEIVSTSANRLTLKAEEDITLGSGQKIQTNNGDVIIWADSDNDSDGSITLSAGTSTSNRASILTSGGNITLGGGSDPLIDAAWSLDGSGVNLDAYSRLVAGTGNVVLNGRSNRSWGNNGFGLRFNQASVNGANITITGVGAPGTGASAGHLGVGLGNNSSILATGIISITGTGGGSNSTGNDNHGILIIDSSIASSGSGGVSLTGTGDGSGGGENNEGVKIIDESSISSASGSLTILGKSGSGNFSEDIAIEQGDNTLGGSSQTGNITLLGDVFYFTDSQTINTSGQVKLEPRSASFNGALTNTITQLSINSRATGLTLGKSGNTSDITIGSAISIAGPITVYGGKIDVDAALTSTATSGSGISLNGQRIHQNDGIDATTSGADISYTASGYVASSGGGNPIELDGDGTNRAILNANGGNISISASFATGSADEASGRAISFGTADLITSGSGAISLIGDASNSGNISDSAWGMQPSNARIITENGAITLELTGGAASSNSRGLAIDNRSFEVLSASGTITIRDIVPTGLSGNYGGTYLRPNANNSIVFGADGSEIANSSSDIVLETDRVTFVSNTSAFTTSGTLSIRPISGSFLAELNTALINSSSLATGYTLGKEGNTSDLKIGSNIEVAGPVSVYAGALDLSANINTSSANGDILLKATTSIHAYTSDRSLNSGSGDISLITDYLSYLEEDVVINSTGIFSFEPASSAFLFSRYAATLDLAGTLSSNNFVGSGDARGLSVNGVSNLSGFRLGKEGMTSNIHIYTDWDIAGPVELFANDVFIDGEVTANSDRLSISSTGAVMQKEPIVAESLLLNGTGTFTLQDASNNVKFLAGGSSSARLGNTSYRDSDALEIGEVFSQEGLFTSGTLLVETLTNDLTLSQSINTTSNSDDAIILNAGRNAAGGTPSGGNIIVSGSPSLTYGSGGRAKLFSGVNRSSTGLSALVGGSSNIRYGFDEDDTISPALADNNAYAIFRFEEGSGNLSIVDTGGDAINTKWRFDSNQIITTSTPVEINASVVEGYLASGDLTVLASNITVEEEVVYSSENRLTLKAKEDISVNADQKIQSNNGDIILWADADADNEGHITVANDVTFNSANGSTASGLSTGGNIILAGGADDGSNGGTASDGIPDGFARSASNSGIELSTKNTGNVNIYSGGGNIVLRGYSSSNEIEDVENSAGIQQRGGFFIDSGTGRIRLLGESLNYYGINLNQSSAANELKLEVTSAATTGDAVYISGVSNSSLGLVFNFSSNKELKATAGGNITLQGVGGGSDFSLFLQRVDILANTGTITLDGGTNGIINKNTGNTYGFRSGSDIISSTSDIIFKGDVLSFDIGDIDTVFNTSGTVTLEPSGTSFSSAFGYPIRNLSLNSSVSGLTLGKTGNTSDITISSATSVAGPITVYGAKIDVDAALTSTATSGSGISLNGQRIIQDDGIDAMTSGADISYIASGYVAEGNSEVPVVLDGDDTNRAILDADGGNISISGSFATGGIDGQTARAISFSTADLITSGFGAISLTADATNNPNIAASAWGMEPSNARIISESGDITLNMIGGAASINSRGLAIEGESLQVLSESGTITIRENKAVGLTGSFGGTYLRPSANDAFVVGADGDEVTSSSSDIVIETDRITFLSRTSAFTTSGTLSIRPISASFVAGLDTNLVNLSNSATGYTLGKAGNTSDISLSRAITIAGPITVYGEDIAISGALTASSSDINLYASGDVTQSAALTASRLALNGSGNFALQNSSNNVGIIAGGDGTTRLGNLAYRDADALEIGAVNPDGLTTSGTILVETENGNLTLSENINTTSTSDDAIILNAGRTTAAGTSSGGDIIVSGTPTISYGSGGRAKLFSGSEANSTGLTALVGGVNNVRFNLDETSDLSVENLTGDNAYAIYREEDNIVPTDITLNPTTINQSATGVDATVGTLSTSDADASDSHTYSLVSGTGDTDNTLFNIDGNTVRTSTALEAGSYSIRINTNNGTDDFAKAFAISITDDVAPNPPSLPDLTAASDTCDSDSDNITTVTTPTFVGSTEVNATITLRSSIDGDIGSVVADSSGNWSITSSMLSLGEHIITAIVTDAADNTSSPSDGLPVTITTLDDASFSYSAADFCVGDTDPTPTVTGLTGGSFSSTAGLSLDTSTGAIDISASTPGTYTVTYSTAGTCSNSSDVDVTINDLDDASFSFSETEYCASGADPSPTVLGASGGTFSSTAGLSLNASSGAIDVSASTPGTYTVTYTTAGACPNSSDVDVTINALDDASFSYSAADYCVSDADPTPTVTGLSGGSFSSTAGLSLNTSTGLIEVSTSTPGTYTVTYTTAGTCPNSSDVNVTINALDDASFSYSAADYCVSDSILVPTITGLSGGSFSSTAGLSLNTSTGLIDASASTPGTYTVTYTTSGTCPNSSDVDVTINALDDASFSYSAADYCVSDSILVPTITGLFGGTFSSTTGLILDTSTGLIDASASTPGTYTVTYTTSGTCPNSSTVDLTINELEDASFSFSAAAFCVNDADPIPNITGLAGGSFSSSAGLSLDSSTGAIDVSASTPGTYTVTYTTAGTCVNSSDVDVTINVVDDASFSYESTTYDVSETDPLPIVSGLAGGSFSSTTGLSIDVNTGLIDLSASNLGTYTITYTTSGPCVNSSTFQLTIDDTLDISEFEKAQVSLYPNPATSQITIEATGINIAKVIIYDLTGKLVKTSAKSQINVSDLSSGAYLVRLIDDAGRSTTRKFIKD